MGYDMTAASEPARRRVLIADDSARVRGELRTLLPLASNIEIVGEAPDGREAIRLAQALLPEVVLIDLEMPVVDGFEAIRQIKAGSPSCRVIVLTVHGHKAAKQKALQAGADDFLVKGTQVANLVLAISARPSDPDECG